MFYASYAFTSKCNYVEATIIGRRKNNKNNTKAASAPKGGVVDGL